MATAFGAELDMNGVGLGASEEAVKAAFPNAHCKALEWESKAAERRCDDGRIRFEGVRARITFFLKDDAVQAIEMRFRSRDGERVAAALKKRWGTPERERHEIIPRKNDEPRELYKVSWRTPAARAALEVERETQRASVLVWRGDFPDEIYEVR